jgi:cell division protein FtsB
MMERKIRRILPINQFLLLLMGLLILYLVADFGRQVVVSYQRQEDLRQIERKIESAQEETRQLEAWLAYVRSPQAAEAWAREQGWARPDEVPVVVIAPPVASSPGTDQDAQENLGSLSHRDAWWALFFGER